jgi:hypothetical protein
MRPTFIGEKMSNPAGWYPDPAGRPQQRFWDGTTWREEVRPFPAPNSANAKPAAPVAQKPKAAPKQTAIGCGVLLALALILGSVMSSCVANAGKVDPATLGDGGHAKVACRGMVEDKLKAPSTADFSNESVSGSGTSWNVAGLVDSQNSFGAKIRSSYTCSLTYSPSDHQWGGSASVG